MAFTPPRKAARAARARSLLVSLLLNGNTPFSTEEYDETGHAKPRLPSTARTGALTAALRTAAESINRALLERNLSTTGRGQYAIGWLSLAALREAQLTMLQCGPTHVLSLSGGGMRHLHDPALSGKGLGLSQTISHFYSQIQLSNPATVCSSARNSARLGNALASDRGLPTLEFYAQTHAGDGGGRCKRRAHPDVRGDRDDSFHNGRNSASSPAQAC